MKVRVIQVDQYFLPGTFTMRNSRIDVLLHGLQHAATSQRRQKFIRIGSAHMNGSVLVAVGDLLTVNQQEFLRFCDAVKHFVEPLQTRLPSFIL